jgi:DNA-directed RNA polymerase subunit H
MGNGKVSIGLSEQKESRLAPSKHVYVPEHEVLSKEEAEEIMKKFNAQPYQFPFILSTDPMVREIGARPGDLIRIKRKSDTAGHTYYYRYVVEG